MQIDKTSALSSAATELSRKSGVEQARTTNSSTNLKPVAPSAQDSVNTSRIDLVQMVLASQDKTAEIRVADLQQEYESGKYEPEPNRIAHAILAGVLCGY